MTAIRDVARVGVILVLAVAAAVPTRSADERPKALDVLNVSTLDRPGGSPGGAVEVFALTDTSRASIRFGRTISKSTPDKGLLDTWTLTASAPLSKSEDKTDLATLDGFVNSFKLETRYSRLTTSGKKPAAKVVLGPLFYGICAEAKAAYVRVSLEQKGKESDIECDFNNIKTYAPNRYEEFRSLFWARDDWKRFWGGSAAIGYEEFKYIDGQTAAKGQDAKNPWSAGVYYGVLPPEWNTLLLFGLEYQSGYKSNDVQTLCPPNPGGGAIVCQTGSINPPKEDDKELISLESRTETHRVGLSARVTFDFKSEVFGVDLPLFLVHDKEKRLSAGIRFGWRDDTDDFSVGVFVGKAFSLSP